MNRRKFVVGSSASLLAPALLRAYGQVPATSSQDHSYAEEMPHMLVSFLVSKLNRLAASWDGKRSLLRNAADVQKRNRVVREKLLSMLGEFPPRVTLNPVIVKASEKDGYRVENIMFE